MGGFWPMTLTPEVFTGNPATVNDPFASSVTPPISSPYPNGARMPLGTPVYVTDSSGRRLKYRYVRLNSTAAVTLVQGQPLFWKDNTFTIVTANPAEGMNGSNGPNFVAGVLVNPSATNGNYILMQTYGYNAQVQQTVAANPGEPILAGSASTPVTFKVAFGTAPSQEVIAIGIGPVVSGSGPALIVIEEGYGL